ncbi:putative purine-specific oxidized base lesion DNA N-glycosylase [Naematelia encephala]|uniref:DNA-(apurinic or apyrimidinic site) lyase n=1 Tax=Naematelia encephala TaxID=71784 RepID=A0A1Y2AKK0_9TREE|nr:putative purine-specific oxidized base lesion DNA N-glycosylase [Naematelia encephala]
MRLVRPPFPLGWSSIPLSPLDLTIANTLPVGQSFLWHRRLLEDPGQPSEEFSRAVDDPPRVVCLRQSATTLYYTAIHPTDQAAERDLQSNSTKRWLSDYFQLDRYPDLSQLYADWRNRDPGLFGKVELDGRATGVRVLRQDPWECLVAFITSTNNHIPRITSLMYKLCQHLSPNLLTLEETDGSTITYHLFPRPHSFPSHCESLLREMGFGYRAAFIESSISTLRQTFGDAPGDVDAGLEALRGASIDDVRQKIIGLKGVGRKVADCVMLMCLDQPSLIPIDTHVGAIAARHPAFPSRLRNKPMSKQVYEEIQAFLSEQWGPMGGWCQAVMFAADLPISTTTPRKAASLPVTPRKIVQAVSPSSTLRSLDIATRRRLVSSAPVALPS